MTALAHEKVTLVAGPRSGLTVIVAIHSTALGQAVGGCRMWQYDDWRAGLDDALRLSEAMTLKCALAELPLGGGKTVIVLPRGTVLPVDRRRDVLLDLGDVVNSLGGSYGVGEDVGTTAEDMAVVAEQTAYAYGLPESSGGTGEPSAPTALGVYESLRVTAETLWGSPDLAGRRVTIIGLGQVGSRLAERLRIDGAKLAVTDLDPGKRQKAAELGADWLPLESALFTDTDILVPAALGGAFTAHVVESLRCAAIVGPANNQLADQGVAGLLAARGILWAPDFLVNAGGVVSGFEMELGSKDAEAATSAVLRIGSTLRDVYQRAEEGGTTPLAAALALAQDRVAAARGQRS